jgi:hypothetical protein
MPDRSLPRRSYNFITITGALIAVIAGVTGGVLLLVGLFEKNTNPYFGIFLYGVIPAILIVGLLLIPFGIYREWRKEKRGEIRQPLKWPLLDLNNPRQRRAAFIFTLGTSIFIIISAVGSYQAYHFSESVEFCGTTCHGVMKPEYVAYQNSPHARVACASCHIGSGAGWFAKSKISGMYQIYAVAANTYPRPIPTPIHNLRPAQETCEQCHWPQKFFGAMQKQFNHYMYDSANTHWPVNLLIKVGGGDPKTGQTSGIHWHMNIANKIEYISADEERQDISWVKATNQTTGQVTIYSRTDDKALNEQQIAAIPKRVMDCMDCHNRPSHIYHPPDHTVDQAILVAQIDTSLPDIKRVSVEAMSTEYQTEAEALTGIANTIGQYYETTYPDLYTSKRGKIDDAIAAVQNAFSTSIFPEMKVKWSAYPTNIGHFFSAGCMRCHNEKLQTADGKHITTDCNACHTILSQGSGDRFAVSTTANGLTFDHPVDIGDEWKSTGCFDCHSGTQP